MKNAFRIVSALVAATALLLTAGCGSIQVGGAAATEAPTEEIATQEPEAQNVSAQPTTVVPTLAPTIAPKIVQPSPVQRVLQPAGSYQGTVKPPGCNGVAISATGQYSICGIAVATVTLKRNDVVIMLMPVDQTPAGAGTRLVASISLSVLVNNQISMGPHDAYAAINMCYAAPAGKSVTVRFYNPQTSQWSSIDTLVQNGQACALANFSGIYVLVQR